MRPRVPLSLFVVWCSVFPLVVDRPEMPCIMAGVYQMDSSSLVVVCGSGMCNAGLAGYDWRRQALDALHHGRYGKEGLTLRGLSSIPGSGMCRAGFTGYSAPRAVFSRPPVVRPRCSASWAVWTVSWCPWFRLQQTVESLQLQSLVVVDISCRGAEADSHGLAVQQTTVLFLLQFLDKVIDGPVVRVDLVFPGRSHARCVQRQVPCLRSAVAAHQQGRLHPCRGAEFVPHGLADHRDSVAVHLVIDVPVVLVVQPPGGGPDVQKNCGFHSCSSCLVVDMPVVAHDRCWRCRRCSSCAGWTSLCSLQR